MNKRPFIVNIVNFIRDLEPRGEMDLYEPVREQLALMEKFRLRGTFLFQYDSLLDEKFTSLLKGTVHETGVWLEIVEPLVKDAGLVWRGRFPWDWHSHVGFSVGYTPEERERLIDKVMEKFKAVFGFYPASVASWLIDAHSLAYLADRYHISASANCKEQWGTDGYTLWGGYYGQAYYPSRTNALAPGNSGKTQIPLPVFRMLGSDPILQYDHGLDVSSGASACQGVITLEPVYAGDEGGGGVKAWVDWFLDEAMTGSCLTFNYAQAGQENSFGWPAMKDGLEYQFQKLSALSDTGQVRIETLEESGVWFRKNYSETPNSAITALSDWKREGKRSVWFCSKRYRVNFYSEDGKFWLRDLMLFDDRYTERYLYDTCKIKDMTYDTLPVIDGNRWTGKGKRAGWYLEDSRGALSLLDLSAEEASAEKASAEEAGENLRLLVKTNRGEIIVTSKTGSIEITSPMSDLCLNMVWGVSQEMETATVLPDALHLKHEKFAYTVHLAQGKFQDKKVLSQDGAINLVFHKS
ncbi:hypothetical protein FACS1894142_7030 [Spirochaetia bacterium]|nr:hypothetical protein FACS1894142_7030 [Spirochaetia bacterium]